MIFHQFQSTTVIDAGCHPLFVGICHLWRGTNIICRNKLRPSDTGAEFGDDVHQVNLIALLLSFFRRGDSSPSSAVSSIRPPAAGASRSSCDKKNAVCSTHYRLITACVPLPVLMSKKVMTMTVNVVHPQAFDLMLENIPEVDERDSAMIQFVLDRADGWKPPE